MRDDSGVIAGPVLFLDDLRNGLLHLSALFITSRGHKPAPIETALGTHAPMRLAGYRDKDVFRARFTLPATAPSSYRWNGEDLVVASDFGADLQLAYVSCNGEETGDMDREGSERNAMWSRLREEHRRAPFALLLHGGDQVYADEVTKGHALSDGWPEDFPEDPSPAELDDLRTHLRERFAERYTALYAAPEFAWLAARVPSLMQWDDHDICDGWGSLQRSRTHSAVGQALFSVARESFLIFQQAAAETDLPTRLPDQTGGHLGWIIRAPGLRIIAPDLRSERTRRDIMGPAGWKMMDTEAQRPDQGHSFLMSSVPLLGPRLSVIEALMVVIPQMQKYEDDLRDQWQSRAHRDEWTRMLRLVRDMARRDRHDVTALSGEIHLATRAVMQMGNGLNLHQLVASGIAHRPPPRGWARTLGALAAIGENPLPGHPIRIERLPGQRSRYVAERNYLVLERRAGKWRASWELEHSGRTEPLAL